MVRYHFHEKPSLVMKKPRQTSLRSAYATSITSVIANDILSRFSPSTQLVRVISRIVSDSYMERSWPKGDHCSKLSFIVTDDSWMLYRSMIFRRNTLYSVKETRYRDDARSRRCDHFCQAMDRFVLAVDWLILQCIILRSIRLFWPEIVIYFCYWCVRRYSSITRIALTRSVLSFYYFVVPNRLIRSEIKQGTIQCNTIQYNAQRQKKPRPNSRWVLPSDFEQLSLFGHEEWTVLDLFGTK